jgi:hypothetical protein
VTGQTRLRRALLGLVSIAAAWAVAIGITGGFSVLLGNVSVSSHSATLPAVLALSLVLGIGGRWGLRSIASDLEAMWSAPLWAWQLLVAVAGLGIVLVGIGLGTFAASGADAFAYISQSTLWLHGALRVEQPISLHVPWPDADLTFSPLGYRPARTPGAIVPTYAPGLPLLMALARTIFGDNAVYGLVPIFGAVLIWLTFVVGRGVDGPRTGAVAALLLACSPVLLFQIVQPLVDVVVAAAWLAVLVLASGRGVGRSTAAGLAASLAIMIRPNLVPVTLVPFVLVFVQNSLAASPTESARLRPSARRALVLPLLGFLVSLIPGIALVAALQSFWYGSPLASGYGTLAELFSIHHVLPNLRRYATWAIATETPVILLGLLAPLFVKRRANSLYAVPRADGPARSIPPTALFAFAGIVVACYLPYTPFEEWWYLRYLLPAIPLVLVLSALTMTALLSRLPKALRTVALLLAVVVLCSWYLRIAAERGAFTLRGLERRYVTTGTYIAERLPERALLFAVQQSGSVRHYSGRLTLRWDLLDPGWLERAVGVLRGQGYAPYFLIEDWEEPAFKARFAHVTPLGGLDWPPRAEIRGAVTVRIYDPLDRARFLAGEDIKTDREFGR